jgi:hypothetical protein
MIDIMKEINWKKFTVNFIIGYAISWIYFLGTLAFIQHFFGKTTGAFINYGLSWIVWFIVFDSLRALNPKGEI